MTVVPGQKGTAGIGEVPDPGMQDGALLVRGMAGGICGTDREIARARTDSFGERDIVRLHGYGSEHWRVEPDFAVPILPRPGDLGVLREPASVLAKAWNQVDQISRRAFFLRGEVPRGHPAPRGCRVPWGSAALLCQLWSVPG